jgi:hypothetical protein
LTLLVDVTTLESEKVTAVSRTYVVLARPTVCG